MALKYLADSLDAGFGDASMLLSNEHLSSLHDAPEWPELVARAKARGSGVHRD